MFAITLLTLTVLTVSQTSLFHGVCGQDSDDGPLTVGTSSFSQDLLNPCRITDDSPYFPGEPADKSSVRTNLIFDVKEWTLKSGNRSEKILRDNMLADCSTIRPNPIATIPLADDLQNDEPLEALKKIYASLLHHTAHVYFYKEQNARYTETCFVEKLPETDANMFAGGMLQQMCTLRQLIRYLPEETGSYNDEFFTDLGTQILSEPLYDLTVCSRRMLSECQTIYSTKTLFKEMASYFRDNQLTS